MQIPSVPRAILALLGLLAATPALAGSYVFTTIDPPGGSGGLVPQALNERGQVVGYFQTGTDYRGCIWQGGGLKVVTGDGAGSVQTRLVAINDAGIAAGSDIDGAILYRIADDSVRHPLRAAGTGNAPPGGDRFFGARDR